MRRVFAIFKIMALLWFVFSCVPLFYYWHISEKTETNLHNQMKNQGLQFLGFIDARSRHIYEGIEAAFLELSRSTLLRDFSQAPNQQLRHYLESQWYITSLNSTRFDQLRYLDLQGKERIRVNFPQSAIEPEIVPEAHLQNKRHRDYFQFAQQLSSMETGYFGIDLEHEYGRPVLPSKPGFRIIYPIENQQERLGYFIANLDVLQLVNELTENSQGLEVSFVDYRGYYLLSTQTHKIFGHVMPQRNGYNMAKEHPQVWAHLKHSVNHSGSYLADEGLFVYRQITTPIFAHTQPLTLVTFYPKSVLMFESEQARQYIKMEAFVVWLLLGLAASGCALLYDSYKRNKVDQAFSNLLIEQSSAVVLADLHCRILRANTRFIELSGYTPENLRGHSICQFHRHETCKPDQIRHQLSTQQSWTGMIELVTANNEIIPCQAEIRPIGSPREYYVLSFTDISEHHTKLLEFKELSERDAATLLWNKKKFEQRLEIESRLVKRYKNHPSCCLAIIDIDHFKQVNDRNGHLFGDQAILFVSQTLRQILRETDVIGRIGGDEFAVILQHVDAYDAKQLMMRVSQAISEWHSYPLTVSIGIAQINQESKICYAQADQALYQAKQSGRNAVFAHSEQTVVHIRTHQG